MCKIYASKLARITKKNAKNHYQFYITEHNLIIK